MLVAQLAQRLQVSVAWWKHATSTLQWLNQHCGDARAVATHRQRQCFDVVGVNLGYIGHEWVVADFVERQPLRAGATEVAAVVPTPARDDDRALRVACLHLSKSGKFHGRVYGLRTTRAQKHSVARHRRERVQLVGEFVGYGSGEWVEIVVRLERADLCSNCFGHVFATMTDIAVPQAGHAVDVLLARVVIQTCAHTTHHGDELGTRGFGEGMQVCGLHEKNPSNCPATSLRTQ